MVIDCDECAARGPACGDCVVSVLLGGPPGERELGDAWSDARPTGRLDIGGAGRSGPSDGVIDSVTDSASDISYEAVTVGLRPTMVYDGPAGLLELDETLRWAVGNLAAAGLVPPLRMLPIRRVSSTQSEKIVTPRRLSAG